MIQVRKRPVLPGIGAMSEAFKDGYEHASTDKRTGWPIECAPNERTIIQWLLLFHDVMNSELSNGRDCEYNVHWMAGLLTGWLRRI